MLLSESLELLSLSLHKLRVAEVLRESFTVFLVETWQAIEASSGLLAIRGVITVPFDHTQARVSATFAFYTWFESFVAPTSVAEDVAARIGLLVRLLICGFLLSATLRLVLS